MATAMGTLMNIGYHLHQRAQSILTRMVFD
ncbi:hypothetical protein PSAC2689_100269 [Paraburkholderia sacchari]